MSEALEDVLKDAGLRLRLAENTGMPESLLAVLACDSDIAVRGAVALNPAASAGSDRLLSKDVDARVRWSLARKMVGLTPPDGERHTISARTYEILSTLVRDEEVRIRRLLSEELARLPHAPHDLIVVLARDTVISVSDPVLRLSPLLTPADLKALLAEPSNAGTAGSIARRANVPAAVSDAIVASASDEAIRALLANPAASIRESTLDTLIERAAAQPSWHEPLVHRPKLPDRAARALSEIVAADLLQALTDREDFSIELVAELKQRLEHRLAGATPSVPCDAAQMTHATQAEARGDLDEAALLAAADAGDGRRVTALLAVAARVGLHEVDHAASLRSAKALVSLVWRAGFTMCAALRVQVLLGHLAPSDLLSPTADGGFPITSDEMRWQLDFLGVSGR